MTHQPATTTGWGRASLTQWIKRFGAGKSPARRPGQASVIEPLESRLMLTALPSASPNFVLFRPPGGVGLPVAIAAPTGLTPAIVRQAYGMNQVTFGAIIGDGDGAGQIIAIVDAFNDPNLASDLHQFDQAFNLPDPVLTVVGQTGTSSLPANAATGGWAVEIALDVEWAHAAAPGADILLVEAKSSNDSDLLAAVDTARNYPGVSVVSMSWGSSEFAGVSALDVHFTTPAGHDGVTFVAAAGDVGSPDVEYPAGSPNVIGVGGTFLTTDNGGSYVAEIAWGNGVLSNSSGGGGGGISRYVNQPAYQNGVVSQYSTTRRTAPDVSMDADPNSGVAIYDSYDNGSSTPWAQAGGTSLATALWAGVMAAANQGRVLAGLGTLNTVGDTQTLPALYSLPTRDFHDITLGNTGAFGARFGYDLASGLGTPVVNLLVADLVGPVTPTPIIGVFTVNPTSVTVNSGTKVTLTADNVVESAGVTPVANVWFYLQNGPALKLLGKGVNVGVTWTLANVSTANLSAGTYTIYAVATDALGVNSRLVPTTLTVVPAALPPPAPLSNDNFSNATILAGTSLTATGANVGATRETGEPKIAGNTGGKSLWYAWTAPANGKVSIDTHTSNFDTLLGVYTGAAVSGLTLTASNDDATRIDPTSAVSFTAVRGVTYHIVVDGFSLTRTAAGAESGNITLHLSEVVTPANDNFADAANLGANSITWAGTNVGATIEAGEPNHARNFGGASVWFTWTATTSGVVTLDTHGSNFDTLLAVYTGNAVSRLATVASNDDDPAGGTKTSALTFNAVAGVTYHIAVDGFSKSSTRNPALAATGIITLNLAWAPSTFAPRQR